MEKYKELGFQVIFNPAYTPQANLIEHCFGVVKPYYRKLKAQNIAKNQKRKEREMIEQAFNKVTKELVQTMKRYSDLDVKKLRQGYAPTTQGQIIS